MEMKSIESNQWKKRLLDEINFEKFSTIFKDNELLSDEVDRFISKSLIYWKDGAKGICGLDFLRLSF